MMSIDKEKEAELLRVAEQWAQAMVENDADRIGSFMADDWVIVSERGVTTKAEFLPFVRSGQLTHSRFELASEPRVRFYGDTAALTARVVNTAEFAGEVHEQDEWTTDVFVRTEGRWLCVLSHITNVIKAG